MKIGILGSGNMGRSLGLRWAENGLPLFFGGRDIDQAKSVADFVGNGAVGGTLEDAARFGDVLVHTARAVPLSEMISDVSLIHGKTVIDLNNRPIFDGLKFEPVTQSLTELLQADAPNTHVVKAFNMFAQELYEHDAATIASHDVSLFMAGNSREAKQEVAALASELGFTPVDAGPLENTRLVETMGDMIRYLIAGTKLGSTAALSVQVLPTTNTKRLGGRVDSNFAKHQSK